MARYLAFLNIDRQAKNCGPSQTFKYIYVYVYVCMYVYVCVYIYI